MGFLDKVKQGAEQAAARAKDTASDLQTKRELGQAYGELGETAFELAEAGELSNPRLDPIVERIRSLKTRLEEEGGAGAGAEGGMAATGEAQTATATTAEPPPSSQPPAMPT
jgi:hypothetical protein